MSPTNRPHPEDNPNLKKVDYICNNVFQLARVNLTLYLSEGASLHEAAKLANHLKICIDAAYDFAVEEVGHIVKEPPQPPEFNQDLDPNNPFG